MDVSVPSSLGITRDTYVSFSMHPHSFATLEKKPVRQASSTFTELTKIVVRIQAIEQFALIFDFLNILFQHAR